MSRPAYELTATARLDLLQIWNYLADEASLEVADQLLRDIESGIELLVESPGLGHTRSDLTRRRLLFHGVGSYLIIYRPRHTPLHVVRVLHGARDVKRILKAE